MAKSNVPISMNKILVAVDGSTHSKKAVELSIDLAKKWNSKIYLIHVREKKNIPEGFKELKYKGEKLSIVERKPFSEYFDMVCERDQFLGEAAEILKSAGINVERICIEGDPADEIIKAAKKYNVDLIVMGSRGLGRFSIAVMGNVSTKVCNHAHCTCITVK